MINSVLGTSGDGIAGLIKAFSDILQYLSYFLLFCSCLYKITFQIHLSQHILVDILYSCSCVVFPFYIYGLQLDVLLILFLNKSFLGSQSIFMIDCKKK